MSSPSPLLHELGLLARRAGEKAQELRVSMTREFKPDGSLVTNADRGVEEFLRRELPLLVPGTTVLGEEFGLEEPGPEGRWAVDPVDGTSNFAYGGVLWGVSIALVHQNQVRLGAVFLADLNEIFLGEAGGGAFFNDVPLRPIPPGAIQPEELVSYDDGLMKLLPQFQVPGKMRCSGAFVVDGCFTAMQRFRGMIGRRERLYDIAACLVINRELGAAVHYLDGSDFDLKLLENNEKIQKPWVIFPQNHGLTVG